MSGYVKISRAIFGHGMFKEEPYTETQAWIWFICGASYKDDTVRVGHLIVDVKRPAFLPKGISKVETTDQLMQLIRELL